MPKLPKISEAEWKVMEVIWKEYPISGTEVARRLESSVDWHIKTVKSLLNRLSKKNAIGYEKLKNAYLYSPLISRNTYIDNHSKGFIDRLFGGSESRALMFFMESVDLNEQDIKKLKVLLKQKQEENHE